VAFAYIEAIKKLPSDEMVVRRGRRCRTQQQHRVSCGTKISFAEGKHCWNNAGRLGGLQYCREHQAAFR
jgi:hypothetical protein